MLRLKFNPHHDARGRSAAKPGGGFSIEEWKAKGMQDARNEWAALDVKQRDRLADAENSIEARVQELLEDLLGGVS